MVCHQPLAETMASTLTCPPAPADTLVAVLERDTLGIREVRLFSAVVRWSEAECQRQQLQVTPENKRKVLGKALALIRFPLMTIEEFAAGNAQGDQGPLQRSVTPKDPVCDSVACPTGSSTGHMSAQEPCQEHKCALCADDTLHIDGQLGLCRNV